MGEKSGSLWLIVVVVVVVMAVLAILALAFPNAIEEVMNTFEAQIENATDTPINVGGGSGS